nr:glycoside hydrolase family 2 protein [Fulvivirga kasyanovii]
MFVKWQHDCKQLLKAGSNELKLYFHSPIKVTRPLYEKAGFTYPAGNDKSDDKLSVYSRKAPYHFGWDWGPRFVTSGIWRPVYLEAWNDLEIADLYVEQNALTEKRAVITAHVELNAVEAQNIDLQLTATSPEGTGVDVKKEHVSLEQGKNNISLTATISDPRRWWPNGMGEPDLYKIKVKAQKYGQTVAEKHLKVGLRTIEVINKPDSDGESFFVKVNDTPVFIKGANYIPSDSFLDRVTSEKYREVFDNAVEANMNMLRVWGGGFYENDEFYDLADERGIMIWQDFMFACSMYPGDDAFLKNVEKEAVYNVKRLRNHPSIALWCGNNEIAIGWVSWGWQKEFGYDNVTQILLKKYYNNLFHKLLPNVVKALDPEKFYLPSSPISDWKKLDDLKIGNNHYWGVWHGELPFSSYNTYVPRFMSEYGFQSFPDIDSVKKYTEQEDWDLMSPVMLLHQKHPRGNALIKKYMEEHYSQPKNFEAFLYLSQLLQAEGIKTAIHAHRRNKPFCMGTLYWQQNDCWPVASWSSVDYYGRWKALQFFVKTAYQEIIASTIQEDDHIEVFVISDSLVPQKVVLEVDVLDFSGKKVYEGRHNLNIAENSSKAVCKTTVKQLIEGKDKASHMLTARIVRDGEVIYEDNHYFVEPKAIKWEKPEIEAKFRQEAGRTVIELSANVLARNVCLKASGFENNFSDNYFDLVPGRKKTVTINTDDHSGLEKDLTVYSLYDACIEI